MSYTWSEKLKDNLRAFVAGRGDGIDIATEYRWVLSGIAVPESFFKNLHLILDSASVLYFEGCSIAPDISNFYESYRAANPVEVVRDTIYPVPETFHVSFKPEVIARLCDCLGSRPLNELFDHVKAYRGEFLLVAFHDAFSNDCLVSGHITEPVIAGLAAAIGATYRKEMNVNKCDKEQLRRLLYALENAQNVHVSGESWWRKLWRRWGW